MTTASRADAAVAIGDALDALDVRSPTSHAWMGEVADLPEIVVRLAGTRGVRRALVGSIRTRLYDSFFTEGAPRPASAPPPRPTGEDRAFSYELAVANASTGCLEPGWRIVAEDDGHWVVERASLRLWVTAAEIVTDDGAPDIGRDVMVRLPADLPALSPGFYMARGERGFSGRPRRLDRVYLDLGREGAVPFVREATRRLNDAGLAFMAKVVDEPGGFDRRDAAVLYFERRDRERALDAADDLAAALAPFLRGGAPAMTLPLGPGAAFAEDPGGAESFGAHRCRLIAEAAVAAAERGLEDLDARLELVRERFALDGIALEAPHLGRPAGTEVRA